MWPKTGGAVEVCGHLISIEMRCGEWVATAKMRWQGSSLWMLVHHASSDLLILLLPDLLPHHQETECFAQHWVCCTVKGKATVRLFSIEMTHCVRFSELFKYWVSNSVQEILMMQWLTYVMHFIAGQLILYSALLKSPEGRLGMSDTIPCLKSQGLSSDSVFKSLVFFV